jgi:hypothetical protein
MNFAKISNNTIEIYFVLFYFGQPLYLQSDKRSKRIKSLIQMYNLFQNQKSTNTAFYLKNTTDNVANFYFYCLEVSEKRGVMK